MKETFTEIYERYSALVIKSVVAQTGNFELANEICQNVFMSFYIHMNRVEIEFVKAWLLHAAKNQVIDYRKKASTRREVMSEQQPEEMLQQEHGSDIEKQYSDRSFICEIMEKLKSTNMVWYEVIDCVCVQQMTSEEACEYLGIPSDVLRSRLHRARQFLHKNFDKDR